MHGSPQIELLCADSAEHIHAARELFREYAGTLNIDAGAMWARRVIDRMVARENSPPTAQAAE